MNIGGIILAGGQSKRMGRDKGLTEFNGKLLVEYAIDLLAPHCDGILISTNSRDYKRFGYPVIKDEIEGIGPAGGILSSLRVTKYDLNIVISCDMPFLNDKAVKLLIQNIDKDKCIIPVHDGKAEPLFGIYHRNFQRSLSEAIVNNELKMKKIIGMHGAIFVNFESLLDEYSHLFKNLNFPADLNR